MTNPRPIQTLADTCVMCGMCSAACPTYQKTQLESESPRGRIALINAWSKQNLEVGSGMRETIEHCLGCGQCERMCPSGVRYSDILRDFKTQSGWYAQLPQRTRILINTLRDPAKSNKLFQAAYLGRKSGLAWLGEKGGILKGLKLEHLNKVGRGLGKPRSWQSEYATTNAKGHIGLFLGCVGRYTDQAGIDASIALLQRLNYSVTIPAEQACCGALAANNGDDKGAQQDHINNSKAFGDEKISDIVYLASGCASNLQALSDDKSARRVIDVVSFLTPLLKAHKRSLIPLDKSILVHTPCSMRNSLGGSGNPVEALSLIPQAKITELKGRNACCGAGGSQLFDPSEINHRLQRELIEDITTHKPDILVTSNTGCHLQLETGLREAGLDIPVVHPVVLLQQQFAGEPS